MLCQHCGYYSGRIAKNRVYRINEKAILLNGMPYHPPYRNTNEFLCAECTTDRMAHRAMSYLPLKLSQKVLDRERIKMPPMSQPEIARRCREIITMLENK